MSKNRWWSSFARTIGMKGLVYSTLAVLIGSALGLGVFTFGYAKGFAYLGNDPKTCNNCHAMNEQYEGWLKGSHHHVAGCNDCHAPHDNLIHKYAVKAENGFWHSLKFTTQDYPLKIKIRESNRKVTEASCVYCHEGMVSGINATRKHDQKISCIQCHSQVGHKR
ncbi:cytochrome c nitrite reductase small subunit [Mobilicoccus massiliensis]|uniref:cytochrome c nitrite reductase small subunit n=1 Tax=Mobilicoccus massiliensis TaxID=1522310 RepID=UPI0009E19671|nr:cytochrome c nitrite reductase small subunit [Mobilicoccus massiliensis]